MTVTAPDGLPVTTACPASCDPDCELGTGGCHERHAYRPAHDPDDCEARRAALDAHSLASAEPGEPADDGPDDGPDDGWVCPACRRAACYRCSDRNCRCCAGSPDDPALTGEGGRPGG